MADVFDFDDLEVHNSQSQNRRYLKIFFLLLNLCVWLFIIFSSVLTSVIFACGVYSISWIYKIVFQNNDTNATSSSDIGLLYFLSNFDVAYTHY